MKKSALRKIVAILLSAVMVFALCACGSTGTTNDGTETKGSTSNEKVVIKLNTSWGENSSVQTAALRFGELLSEATDGRFEVKVYPSNQLASGNQQTAVERCRTAT